MRKFDNINNEIENDIPDLKENINSKIDWNAVFEDNKKSRSAVAEQVIATEGTDIVVDNSNRLKKGVIAAAIVVMVALFLTTIVFASMRLFVPNGQIGDGSAFTITISVNPRVSFTMDENDIVVSQKALNEDGAIVLVGVSYIGKTYQDAVSEYVKAAEKLGYISANDNVSIYASNGNIKDGTKVDALVNLLGGVLADVNFGEMSESEFDKIEDELENFDEDAFTDENMAQLVAAVKAELAKKTGMVQNILTEIDSIQSKEIESVVKLQSYNTCNDDDEDDDEDDDDDDDDDEVNNGSNTIVPTSDLEQLKLLIQKYLILYYDDDIAEINLSNITYKDLVELEYEFIDVVEDLVEASEEIAEITDFEDVSDGRKDMIEDLLEIVKDDVFDKD